ncbi:hypothetical protein ACWC2K_05785 [Streptomyces chattanoogensis]|uniref:hypothetical protein n=1 Tax=Streptomyces chattanoogensis TaxID=66876 RepID=UPI0036996900
MLIRLRHPWRARLIVACTVLALVAAGVTLLLWDAAPAPAPYEPLSGLSRHQGLMQYVTYASEGEHDTPPGPATIAGSIMLAVALGLGIGGCLIGRRRAVVI